MSLQPYQTSDQALALYQGPQLSAEEIERRQKEAEELDQKLRHIVEDVPDRVYHVMGSNAGAGSGEFHTYRHSRRREQERLKRIDEDAERAEKDQARKEKAMKLVESDEARTSKRRAKRQKKKEKQLSKRHKLENNNGQDTSRAQARPEVNGQSQSSEEDGDDGAVVFGEQPGLD